MTSTARATVQPGPAGSRHRMRAGAARKGPGAMRWIRAGPCASGRIACWVAAVVVVLIVGGCGSVPGAPPRSPRVPVRPSPPAHSVDEAAFAGRGELAFVSRGELWVLDGATGAVRRVPAPGTTPLDPAFSPDGRWLAFLGSGASPSGQAYTTVWLATGDGSGAHQIVASGGLIGWSPAADVLAVTAGNAIRLVWPSGAARTLVRAPGRRAADGMVAGDRRWRELRHRRGGLVAGPGHRLLGTGGLRILQRRRRPALRDPGTGARPRQLGATLADSRLDQVAAGPGGRLAIVAETPGLGGGRVIWQDKAVKICGPAGACAGVPSPASVVTLDPAWSPDGATLALVRAPYRASPVFPQNAVAAWYDAHQLWLYDPARRSLRRLGAGGASVPIWSADGSSLLYVAHDGIWLLPSLTGRPARIAGPLLPPSNWSAYYGQVGWLSQFAWWQGPPSA